jgi:hypothetical protein
LKDEKLWKELIWLLSVDGQPTKEILAQTCVGIFFICLVSDTVFFYAFSCETACVSLQTTWQTPQTIGCPQTTV